MLNVTTNEAYHGQSGLWIVVSPPSHHLRDIYRLRRERIPVIRSLLQVQSRQSAGDSRCFRGVTLFWRHPQRLENPFLEGFAEVKACSTDDELADPICEPVVKGSTLTEWARE
jgi:hypothetical protein